MERIQASPVTTLLPHPIYLGGTPLSVAAGSRLFTHAHKFSVRMCPGKSCCNSNRFSKTLVAGHRCSSVCADLHIAYLCQVLYLLLLSLISLSLMMHKLLHSVCCLLQLVSARVIACQPVPLAIFVPSLLFALHLLSSTAAHGTCYGLTSFCFLML